MASTNKKVLISGAGIAGCALALFLQRLGFEITIVEKRVSFEETGFPICLFPNGIKVLQELDVFDTINDKLCKLESYQLVNCNDTFSQSMTFENIEKLYCSPMQIDRNYLHSVLYKKVQSKIAIQTNTTITTAKRLENLRWEIGFYPQIKTTIFDFVFLCEGATGTSKKLFGWERVHKQSDFVGFAYLTKHKMEKQGIIEILAPNACLGIYPYEENKASIMFSVNKTCIDSQKTTIQNLKEISLNWKSNFQSILNEVVEDSEYCFKFMQFSENVYAKNNVFLVGDSAHTIYPYIGMGASQALTDAMHLYINFFKGLPTRKIEENYNISRVALMKIIVFLSYCAFESTFNMRNDFFKKINKCFPLSKQLFKFSSLQEFVIYSIVNKTLNSL